MTTITAAATFPINAGGFNTPAGQVAYAGTAYSGTFIPALWSGKLAQKFYAATVFGEIANTDWQGDISGMGDTVIINTIPSINIYSYSAGQNLNYDVPTPSTITLKISKGKYFGVNVNNLLELQSKPKLMDLFTNDAAMQMKIQIDRDVLYSTFFSDYTTTSAFNVATVTQAETGGTLPFAGTNAFGGVASYNYGAAAGRQSGGFNLGNDISPITLSAANIIANITALSSVLDEADVPETDRYLVISPAERQLLMQSAAAQAQFMGDQTSILRNGRIGLLDRFVVYVSNLLPRGNATKDWANNTNTTGANLSATTGFSTSVKRHMIVAGHKSALTFASQIAKVESLQNPNDFGTLVRGLNVYGNTIASGNGVAVLCVTG
jgi:hypothetical protein